MNYNLVEFYTSYGMAKQLPESTNLEIVFVGRSNVGKSTLINKVFNRKSLARVSSMPGKTSTINFFKLNEIYFVDLPGYGYAKVAKTEKKRWAELIDSYFLQDRNIGLILQLVDIRHTPTVGDVQMIEFLIDNSLPFIIVLTKMDKLNKAQLEKRLVEIKNEIPCGDEIKFFPVSSIKNLGFDKVREVIDEVCEEWSKSVDLI
ncbi:MAG: ribosome biogenesis GTP-binding protein YihA/YsxC [Oscillospiraceae bacterium]